MKKKLQVFVSSTFTDLIEERQAAVSAILKAGHIPAGMELFTAGDRSQMATIEEWINESDVYMLILGGRYGSVETESGVSYTELEFDYAQQMGKPSFAVVITDQALEQKIRAKGSDFGEKENPKQLRQFREKVLTKVSSFFEDCKDIKLCVHESLADFVARRELKGWVSGGEIVDTRPLFEEIKKLSEENKLLKASINEIGRSNSSTIPLSSKEENFEELEIILQNIEVTVPSDFIANANKKMPLLDLVHEYGKAFVNGVYSNHMNNKLASFLFNNISPKLQLHGLTANELVGDSLLRRCYATPLGIAFLAHLERKIAAKKMAKNAD